MHGHTLVRAAARLAREPSCCASASYVDLPPVCGTAAGTMYASCGSFNVASGPTMHKSTKMLAQIISASASPHIPLISGNMKTSSTQLSKFTISVFAHFNVWPRGHSLQSSFLLTYCKLCSLKGKHEKKWSVWKAYTDLDGASGLGENA